MKTEFWCFGKTEEPYLREGIEQYIKRLKHYLNFGYHELSGKDREKEIDKLLKANDYLVLLDERGQEFTSKSFAQFLQQKFNSVAGRLIFLVGDAYGFPESISKRADFKLALSQLTFTHEMVRLIFLEQLYRGMTILKNEKYHH
jgi:23S rRNA (pseudouridine1915-N3)-methyltransferase